MTENNKNLLVGLVSRTAEKISEKNLTEPHRLVVSHDYTTDETSRLTAFALTETTGASAVAAFQSTASMVWLDGNSDSASEFLTDELGSDKVLPYMWVVSQEWQEENLPTATETVEELVEDLPEVSDLEVTYETRGYPAARD